MITYLLSFSTLSFGFTKFLSSSVPCAVITHASTFDPLPKSLKIPAEMAAVTNERASSRCKTIRNKRGGQHQSVRYAYLGFNGSRAFYRGSLSLQFSVRAIKGPEGELTE